MCLAIVEILTVSIDLVRQDTAGIMPFPLPEPFCHLLKIPCLVVGVKGETFQPCPPIYNTDVQLRAKLHRLTGFSPYNGSDEGLAHTDDSVRHAMGTVIMHILLLLINGANRIQTFHLSRGQRFSKGQFAINGIQVTPEVSQLFSNCFAGHLGGMLAASCVFQVIFPGALAVSAGLLPVCRIMENIQKFLGVLSGLIDQRNVLGIPDIGRCTGGVYDHSAAVAASSRTVIRVIVILVLDFF